MLRKEDKYDINVFEKEMRWILWKKDILSEVSEKFLKVEELWAGLPHMLTEVF